MKSLFLLTLVAYGVQSLAINKKWHSFKATFDKHYSNEEEETLRRAIFLDNVERIERHNKKYQQGLVTYTLGINKFSDLAEKELRALSTGLKVPAKSTHQSPIFQSGTDALPPFVDWRDKIVVVPPVKDQGDCGSCWAFSSTGALEYHYAIYENLTLQFSEQQLVDCVYDSDGCQGGWMKYAFLYIKHNLGINTEGDYPYEAKDGTCRFNRKIPHYNITDIVHISVGSEEDLQAAVALKGPVSVAVSTFGDFYNYKSGIYYSDSCDPDALFHAMVVVGYGTEDGLDYWLVKNSFSEDWGERGYIRMSRNRDNNCGIANRALFPLL